MSATASNSNAAEGPVGVWAFELKPPRKADVFGAAEAAVYLGNDYRRWFIEVESAMFTATNFDKKRYAKGYELTAKSLWKRMVYAPPQRVSDETKQARIDELEKEIAALRQSASSEATKKPDVQPSGNQSGGSLPPPSTYAEAVRREFNRAKHAEARADKLNRAKMAAVSSEAAKIRQQEKERALREKFKEGYVSLDVRKNKQRIAEGAKVKTKPTSVVQKAALVAHTFVRFTRAQMKEHQAAVLKASGADRWFSAAERAAFKALSPARKAEIKAVRNAKYAEDQARKAAEREKFRKERVERVAALSKARVEALAKPTQKQRYSGNDKLFAAKAGKATYLCSPCRFVINSAGTGTNCRDCGRAGTTE